MPITTNVVSLNPTHCEVYPIQPYVIKLSLTCSRFDCFLCGTPVSSTNKTDHHDIAEILLIMALHTITLTQNTNNFTAYLILHPTGGQLQ